MLVPCLRTTIVRSIISMRETLVALHTQQRYKTAYSNSQPITVTLISNTHSSYISTQACKMNPAHSTVLYKSYPHFLVQQISPLLNTVAQRDSTPSPKKPPHSTTTRRYQGSLLVQLSRWNEKLKSPLQRSERNLMEMWELLATAVLELRVEETRAQIREVMLRTGGACGKGSSQSRSQSIGP